MAFLPRLVEGIASAVGGQDGELALEASLHAAASPFRSSSGTAAT
jgi:hypothetical protein